MRQKVSQYVLLPTFEVIHWQFLIMTDIKKNGNIVFEIETLEKECVLSASFSFNNVLQIILCLLPLISNQKTMME